MSSTTTTRSHIATLDRLYVSPWGPHGDTSSHASADCPLIEGPGTWEPTSSADGWLCTLCIDVRGGVRLAAGENIDPPEHGDGAGRKTTAAPAEVRWTKHDKHGWVLRVPPAVGADEGATVTVHKADGSTTEAVLGRRVGTHRGDHLHVGLRPGDQTDASHRPNRYEGSCGRCGQSVAAEKGRIEKGDSGWVTYHLDGTCPAPPAASTAAAPAASGLDVEVGRVYAGAGGEFIRVYESKAGRTYGKVRTSGGWEYDPGALRRISGAVTAEQAAAWGHEHDRCCFCGRNLSDDGPARSVQVGYGPKCAADYGLPWG